jgi:CRISPR-associated protein Cmr3
MTEKQWIFSQLDTWFFRESRPYNAIGGSQLATVFPPSARTVAGAVRTLIGEQAGINWEAFNDNKGTTHNDLHEQIGDADNLGKLQLIGPYLLYKGERLYPVPLILLEKDGQFTRLCPGEPVECDIGYVRLPALKETIAGAKPIENAWLTTKALEQVLADQNPSKSSYHYSEELFDIEPRLGIALNRESRTVEESMLYQNQHIRIRDDNLQIGIIVKGIKETLHPKMEPNNTARVRFGGEGRLAEVKVTSNLPKLAPPDLSKTKKIMLTLLSPANLEGDWLPQGFTEVPDSKEKNWRGTLNGVELTIISAVLGKSIREGGWDLARKQPREVISLIPAGSVWFCQLEKGNAEKLQGYQIGKETEFGRGEIAVGIW